MEGLKIYSEAGILALTKVREGEIKLGQKVRFVESLEDLHASSAQFVLLGIPEDIGVRANGGIAGTATAWEPALKALLNIQSTPFLAGEELLVLGHFEFADPADDHDSLAETGTIQLQQKVSEIDDMVFPLIQKIIGAGKIPIIIGGGHNNAYPIIKGCSLGLNTAIDVTNIDAHADLRPTNGRHSGNGFSYAIKDGYLNHYGIFGLQQNYNNEAILHTIHSSEYLHAVFFDDLLKSGQSVVSAWKDLLQKFDGVTGLELDLDSIANVLSSASGPSGFSLNEIRTLILAAEKKFAYLHICEGAVSLTDGRQDQTTAKTIAYLISDFIKSQRSVTPSQGKQNDERSFE